jgi:hypothetical protein
MFLPVSIGCFARRYAKGTPEERAQRSAELGADPELARDVVAANPVLPAPVSVLGPSLVPEGCETFVPFFDHAQRPQYGLPSLVTPDAVELMARYVWFNCIVIHARLVVETLLFSQGGIPIACWLGRTRC